MTTTQPLTVTVLDTDGLPQVGLPVYAFDGTTYTNYSKSTNSSGQAVFTLPPGNYRFRADKSSSQYWSGTTNHCTVPGCTSATVSLPAVGGLLQDNGTILASTQPKSDTTIILVSWIRSSTKQIMSETPVSAVGETQQGTQSLLLSSEISGKTQSQQGTPPLLLSSQNTQNLAENPTQTTISYTYDFLYRLTDAVYSNGIEFHYSYDAVGNRLTQTTCTPNIPCATTAYSYDGANRLIAVDGVTYTWDDAGNLLSDGTSTYGYDSQNRLTSLNQGGHTYAFTYNGLGDRLTQSVDGVITRYTLDLNAGLTQVLSDGSYAYLYGNDRIAQVNGNEADYFLGDALGSVRQLVDASGAVKLAKRYEPYGTVIGSNGSESSAYAFTGEMYDVTRLVFLRARYLSVAQGRFLNADPSRLESNLYNYAKSNPVNQTDPSGLFSRELIAKNLNAPSFDEVINLYQTGRKGINLTPGWAAQGKKWGWLATLLTAEDGDTLRVGKPVLNDQYPHFDWSGGERIWLAGCDQIMVGDSTLFDYTGHVVAAAGPSDFAASYWRDTSVTNYVLVKNHAPGVVYYVDGLYTDDGTAQTDLPDFHSVDIGAPVGTDWAKLFSGDLKAMFGPGFTVSLIADRYGNLYATIGPSYGAGFSAGYTEGYVCGNSPAACSQRQPTFLDEDSLRKSISGFCVSVGGGLGVGRAVYQCATPGQSPSNIATFSAGFLANAGLSGTYTRDLDIGYSPWGWNWIIEERASIGITLDQLQAMKGNN